MFLKCSQRHTDDKVHLSWSGVESRRYGDGKVAQRHVRYLGEFNDSQRWAWQKTIIVFDETQGDARPRALFPADRLPPESGAEAVQVRLDDFCGARTLA